MADLGPLRIVEIDPQRLGQHPENANSGDVDAIAESIRVNGFYAPIIVQASSETIIAGNHRWMAALKLGLKKVPVLYLDVDDIEAKRIMVADNRTNRIGRDDPGLMLTLLTQLHDTEAGLAGTGYEYDDYAALAHLSASPEPFDDPFPLADPEPEPRERDDDDEHAVVKKRLPFHLTPVADEDGFVRELRVEKVGLGTISPRDLNDLRVALGYAPLSAAELRSYEIPGWTGLK